MADFAQKIASKDEVKTLKKKIQILKLAVVQERKNKTTLETTLGVLKNKLWKLENEVKKKQEKNQTLLVEIRDLKDALIIERNEKQKYIEELVKKQNETASTAENGTTRTIGNYFGLRNLWN